MEADLAFARVVLDAAGHFGATALFNSVEAVIRRVPGVAEAVYGDPALARAALEGVVAAFTHDGAERDRALAGALERWDLDATARFEAARMEEGGEPLDHIEELELRDAGYRYESSGEGVDGLSLVLRRGEAIGVIGHSGAGKSTFAELVLGVREPTSGEVWFEGYEEEEHVWQSTGGTDDFEAKLSLTPLVVGTLKGTIYSLLLAIPLGVLGAMFAALLPVLIASGLFDQRGSRNNWMWRAF